MPVGGYYPTYSMQWVEYYEFDNFYDKVNCQNGKLKGYHAYTKAYHFRQPLDDIKLKQNSPGTFVIGTEGDPNGWWEGPELDQHTPQTYKFCLPQGSTKAKKPDFIIKFDNCYTQSNTYTTNCIIEGQVW